MISRKPKSIKILVYGSMKWIYTVDILMRRDVINNYFFRSKLRCLKMSPQITNKCAIIH